MNNVNNQVRIEIGNITNTCFVVMPFDPLFQNMYERVIRPAVEELRIECVRGDEIYSKPSIVADIWRSLRNARFVIAELTGRNPNVFYEVGLAHAIGKPILLLTREEEDVPFDLKALRYTFYDTNDPFWGENLRKAIRSVVQNILDTPGLSSYLEGVTSEVELPDLSQLPVYEEHLVSPVQDVSGNWQGTWKRSDATIPHSGTLVFTQSGTELSATLIVTFEKDGEQTVVQEALTGSLVDSSRVVLDGISYTYIRQGNSSSYLLDSFSLAPSEDTNTLEGEFRSARGKGTALFNRITSSSNNR